MFTLEMRMSVLILAFGNWIIMTQHVI
uniref:Uncharacterized protein n=1 Tax=Arundo donax TaxID=35708 RepID=A0A0A9A190_ARUDO